MGLREDRSPSVDQGLEIPRKELLVLLGKYAEQKNQYHQALEFLQEASKKNPEDSRLYFNIGRILRILGRHEEALETLRRAVSISPDLADAYNEIGVVYRTLRRYEEAIKAHQEAIRISSAEPVFHFSLGHTLSRMGQFESALEMFDVAIKLDPYYAEPYQGYGWIYAKRGQVEEAVRSYSQALQLNPRSEYACGNLGDLYYQSGDVKEALRLFDLAIKINPYYRYPAFAKTKILLSQGFLKEAIQVYEALLPAFGDDPEVYQRLAECYGEIDREKAAYFWEKAASAQKDETWKHILLGNARFNRKEYLLAAEEYKKAIALSPDNPFAYYNLGSVSEDAGDYPAALQAYQKAIEIDPSLIDTYRKLAAFYRRRLNDPKRAVAVYKTAQKAFPKEASLWVQVGDIYLDQGRFLEAKAEILQALKMQPDNVDALYEMGYIYFEQKDYSAALQLAEKIRNIDARSAHSYWLLKNIAYKQGRWRDVIHFSKSFVQVASPAEIDDSHFLESGYAFERLLNYKKAVETYQRLLRKSSDLQVQIFVRGYIVTIVGCSKLRILWMWHWLRGADHWLGKRLGLYSS